MENQSQNEYNASFHNPGNKMALVSLIFGVGSVFTTATVFLPLFFAGLSVVFALLSKGYGKKMLTQAKVGLISGLVGLAMTIVMFISSFALLISNPEILTEIGAQYDATCEMMYGQSSEEMFGYSFEDMMEEYADMFR